MHILNILFLAMYFSFLIFLIGREFGKIFERKKIMRAWAKEKSAQCHAMVKDFPHSSTFRCNICQSERNNHFISVIKYKTSSPFMTVNIKYCNDKAFCVIKAYSLEMWHGESVYKIPE